jgi:hypothetical protein
MFPQKNCSAKETNIFYAIRAEMLQARIVRSQWLVSDSVGELLRLCRLELLFLKGGTCREQLRMRTSVIEATATQQ